MLLELDMLDKLPNLDVITENWCRGRARDVSHPTPLEERVPY